MERAVCPFRGPRLGPVVHLRLWPFRCRCAEVCRIPWTHGGDALLGKYLYQTFIYMYTRSGNLHRTDDCMKAWTRIVWLCAGLIIVHCRGEASTERSRAMSSERARSGGGQNALNLIRAEVAPMTSRRRRPVLGWAVRRLRIATQVSMNYDACLRVFRGAHGYGKRKPGPRR